MNKSAFSDILKIKYLDGSERNHFILISLFRYNNQSEKRKAKNNNPESKKKINWTSMNEQSNCFSHSVPLSLSFSFLCSNPLL